MALLTNTGTNAVDGAVSWILRTSPSLGTGTVAVTQDYPTANALQPTNAAGSPIDDMVVRIYTAADYAAGRLGDAYVKGMTMTNVNGDWEEPIYLDPATYKVVFSKTGQRTNAQDLTVTSP